MAISRRFFLAGSAAALAGGLLPRIFQRRAYAEGSPYGPLVPDPEGILDLPAGFAYQVIDRRGDAMNDGYKVPGRPDGMACFAGAGGTLVLMRNHENSPFDFVNSPYGFGQSAPPEAFTPGGLGGVTRLVLDAETYERVSSNLVLVGTNRNCAGGPSPWGWLSCEENVDAGHGYVFVCPIDASSVRPAQKLAGYGRFEHEAVAIDPLTLAAYLTEDKGDSCLYRFVPTSPAAPFVGKLQAMRVVGQPGFDTASGLQVGDVKQVEWVDLLQPDPSGDTVRVEAQQKGAARIKRGEGIWYADGAMFIVSTTGGPVNGGQVFRLLLATMELELVAQSQSKAVLDMPDNITVAPWGELFLSEDGDGDNFVRVVAADGSVVPFARNARSDSELCGVCFAPDGRALFVNLQVDGLTLVVTGPFPVQDPPPAEPDAAVPPPPPGEPDAGEEPPPPPGPADAGSAPPVDPDQGGGGQGVPGVPGCACEVGESRGEGASGGLLTAAAVLLGGALLRRGEPGGER